ncbi:histidine kinase [Saprospiraceae bacterium]|nr:histidine kinase [Saprospiraceae bacterium]
MLTIRNIFSLLTLLAFWTSTSLSAQLAVEGEDYLVFKRNINDGLSQNFVISLAKDSQGMIWIGTLDGINMFDGKQFREMGQHNTVKGPFNDFYEIHPAGNKIFTRRDDGFHQFELKDKIWSQDSILREADGMIYTKDGRTLLAINGLLHNYDKGDVKQSVDNCEVISDQGNTTLVENTATNEIYSLSTSGLLTAYESNSLSCRKQTILEGFGNRTIDLILVRDKIWAITSGSSILQINADLEVEEEIKLSYNGTGVESLVDLEILDDKVFVAADQDGVFQYDITSSIWTHKMVRLADNPQGEHEYIIKILVVDNRVYFGSTTNGLLIYDPQQINFYRIPEINVYNSTIYDLKLPRKIIEDNQDNIWISTTGQGLWKYDKTAKTTVQYTQESHPDFMNSNGIRQIKFINNKLWLGYNGKGVDVINTSTMSKEKSFPLEIEGFSPFVIINDIYEDPYGDVWIATDEQGLFIIGRDGVKHFHKDNSELEENRIYNIRFFEDELLLASFEGNIYTADMESNSIIKKNINDGQGGFNIKCLEKDADGNIWIGTGGQGIIVLDNNWKSIDTFSIATGDLLSDELCIIQKDAKDNMWAASNKGLVKFVNEKGHYINERIYLTADGLQSNEFMTGAYLIDDENKIWMGNINGINYWNPDEMDNSKEDYPLYLLSAEFDNELQENIFSGQELGAFNKGTESISFLFSTIGFVAQDNISYMVKLDGYEDSWRNLGNRNFMTYTNIPAGKYSFQLRSTNYDGVWSEKTYSWPLEIKENLLDKWWFYFGLLALLSFLGFNLARWYSDYRIKQGVENSMKQRERLEMEMRALRAQINPHFLFNTLSSINNFILKNEKTIASQYLVKFSRLIRKILNYNSSKIISLEEELAALELYIELEQMRLGDSFDYFVNNQLQLNLSKIKLPPLILQPVVENAIWHGLTHKEGNQILTIDIQRKNAENLLVVVRDNGIGREQAAKIKGAGKSRSYGMEITSKRMKLWFEKENLDLQDFIEFNDLKSEDGVALGTEVFITIPLKIIDITGAENNIKEKL